MKRGALEHYKTLRLASLLTAGEPHRPCDRAEALGIVEALCNHVAPRSAPQGDIGKLADVEIATACCSAREASLLVASLVAAGWLDPHPTYRLLIHDWEDHADEAVRKWLLRNHLPWLTASGPRRVGVRTVSRRRLDTSRRRRDGVDPPRAGNGNGNGSERENKIPETQGGLGGVPAVRTLAEGFAAFWGEYPVKKGKQDAWAVWQKLAPDAALVTTIRTAVARLRALDVDWRRGYVPHPATLLRGRRWEDEPKTPPLAAGSERTAGNAAAAAAVLGRTS